MKAVTTEHPPGWAKVPLQQALLPTSTFNPRTAKRGEFYYIDIEAIDNKKQQVVAPKRIANRAAPSRARNAVQAGDVIFALVRPYLKNIAIVPVELDSAVASTAFFVCRPGPGINNRYILNILRQDSFIASIATYGSSPPAARDDEFEKLPVVIAPAKEQERIADVLDELLSDLDAAVAALDRVREKLKLYRASVLKAAVEGSLSAEWRKQHPHTEAASELLERILIERRRRWEEDQLAKFKGKGKEPPKNWKAKYKEPAAPNTASLPPLPEGWSWVSFDHVGLTQGGIQKSPARAPKKNHYPYLRVANVLRGSLDLADLHRFELTQEELSRLRLQAGDILIVEGNGSRTEIGRCALWRGEVENCVHQNHLIRVRPLPGVLSKYANTFLNSPIGQMAIQHVASSTSGLYTLNISKIKKLPLALLPSSEQEAIVEAVEDQLSVIDHLEGDLDAKVKSAQGLRQAILRHAFTGRLVPQDPNDEPAEELLKRITAARQAHATEARTSQGTPEDA